MATGCIYLAKCQVNNKMYIGQTLDSNGFKARRRKHIKISKKPEHPDHSLFHRAIAKHGAENFTWEVLLQCNAEQLDEYEEKAIALYDTVRPKGYNIRSGGSGIKGVRGAAYNRKIHPDDTAKANVSEYWKEGVHVGYQAKFNSRYRLVTSKHLNLTQKKQMCEDWLDDMRNGRDTRPSKTRSPANADLPPGIYRLEKRNAFHVNVKNFKQRPFKTFHEAIKYHSMCLQIKDTVDDIISKSIEADDLSSDMESLSIQ